MSLRNVTLTAVAALSFGMAAHAQTTTTTPPVNQPGAATTTEATGATTPAAPTAEAQAPVETTTTAPETTTQEPPVAESAPVAPDTSSREAISDETAPAGEAAEVAPAATSTTPASPEADATANTTATADQPAPAAEPAEAAESGETGTAEQGAEVSTPTPTAEEGEPPAAPSQGLPAEATEPQVDAAVPATSDAEPAQADAPAEEATTDAPAADAEAPATDAADAEEPAAEAATEAPAEEPATEAPAEEATAEEPAAEAAAGEEAAAAEGEHAEGEHAEGEADAHAAHQEIKDVAFSFEGPFGKYDQFQLQRGLQVYTEVCASCHGLKQVALRTLHDEGGPGLPEDQMRAYAAALSIVDPLTEEERPREPTDHFPTISGEGMGPDLSLMAKARAGFHGPYGTGLSQLFNGIGGPEYIYSILTGYTGKEMEQAGTVLYENTAFPGGWISMAPPLSDDQVTFEDGSPSDVASMAKDMAAFLMWTAEPKLMDRKQVGFVSVLFLIVLAVLLYLTNKRIWWPIKHRDDVLGDGR